jgi:hypothetical protein
MEAPAVAALVRRELAPGVYLLSVDAEEGPRQSWRRRAWT